MENRKGRNNFSIFCKFSITLISKPNMDVMSKENYRPEFFINIDTKIFTKY